MVETRFEDDDPILPVRITHQCDQIWDGDSLEQEYNYLVYEFETEHHTYTARAYLDEINSVAIFGPVPKDHSTLGPLTPAKIDERVIAYLRRRYSKLQRLTSNGYVSIK